MQCPHFDAGECRSCPLMGVPYAEQLDRKQAGVRRLLDPVAGTRAPDDSELWLDPVPSRESGFRNKAKMVVTGTAENPRLGILDPRQHPKHHDGTGVDLRDCGLYEPALGAAFPVVAEVITAAALAPYNVGTRTGELKHVIMTLSPSGGLMVRFVLRSTDQLPALRAAVPALLAALPNTEVVTANLLPEHRALLEGPEEIHLAGAQTLTMRLNGIPLNLRPQGFFQTNTAMAATLYSLASEWLDTTDAVSVWDLYCGVGGFGFQLAEVRPHDDGRPGPLPAGTERTVWGLETSADAVAAAQVSARELGVQDRVRFAVGDATAIPTGRTPDRAPDLAPEEQPAVGTGAGEVPAELPDAVVVNPPRRGIGSELADWIEASGIPHVLYSSCNATTLARDLEHLPGYRPVRARLLDMFPQTEHYEVLMLLERR
ncbi:methyltransferase domain-containing protein [Citricoccus parietis]|uniref:Methyltransferase domain-containing protein n=2 Tax=Citricoccus parietis TaxID=592307 RepID=A0ABV5G0W1_9MICC